MLAFEDAELTLAYLAVLPLLVGFPCALRLNLAVPARGPHRRPLQRPCQAPELAARPLKEVVAVRARGHYMLLEAAQRVTVGVGRGCLRL